MADAVHKSSSVPALLGAPPTGKSFKTMALDVLFAIEQPADVDVGEIVIRPTAQA